MLFRVISPASIAGTQAQGLEYSPTFLQNSPILPVVWQRSYKGVAFHIRSILQSQLGSPKKQ